MLERGRRVESDRQPVVSQRARGAYITSALLQQCISHCKQADEYRDEVITLNMWGSYKLLVDMT